MLSIQQLERLLCYINTNEYQNEKYNELRSNHESLKKTYKNE